MNISLARSQHIFRTILGSLILLAAISVGSEEKVNKMTYLLSGSEGYCELNVSDVKRGEVIKPWARIRNVGTTAVCVKDIRETIFGPPSDSKPLDASLEPGQEIIHELNSIETENFLGDICKTYSLRFDPPGVVEVVIYRSLQDLEKDK
ncbi:MAG TPA: hypothetical protein PK747_06105 [Acidobacteriota bacterium]|nr:hypothetical protein [Acidobacteriota bacterium]HQQ46968.1 hypothetical protein [Acidobacteriota bacterium]